LSSQSPTDSSTRKRESLLQAAERHEFGNGVQRDRETFLDEAGSQQKARGVGARRRALRQCAADSLARLSDVLVVEAIDERARVEILRQMEPVRVVE
jgi:uncharacterized membrane protein YcjF (UPF0283 family)